MNPLTDEELLCLIDDLESDRLDPARHHTPTRSVLGFVKLAGIGARAGAGRPKRAAWMARARKSVALAQRRRQVSMTLASRATLCEPTGVRVSAPV